MFKKKMALFRAANYLQNKRKKLLLFYALMLYTYVYI